MASEGLTPAGLRPAAGFLVEGFLAEGPDFLAVAAAFLRCAGLRAAGLVSARRALRRWGRRAGKLLRTSLPSRSSDSLMRSHHGAKTAVAR